MKPVRPKRMLVRSTILINRAELQTLYQYCFSLTKNPSDAEDLLQTAIEKYMKKSIKVDDVCRYLRTVIRNQFIDDCRRAKIIAFESFDEHSPVSINESDLEQLNLHQNLIQYIFDALKVGEREILFMWAVLGYTTSEIAEETNQPRNTILSRLHRIKQKAMQLLSEEHASIGQTIQENQQ